MSKSHLKKTKFRSTPCTLIQIWPSVSRKRKIRWTRCLLKCMQFQVATMRVLLSLKGFMIEVLAETLTELSIVAKVVDMTSYNVRSHRCHKSWLLPIYEFQTFDRLIQVLESNLFNFKSGFVKYYPFLNFPALLSYLCFVLKGKNLPKKSSENAKVVPPPKILIWFAN